MANSEPAAAQSGPAAGPRSRSLRTLRESSTVGLAAVVVLVSAVFAFIAPNFVTASNIANVARASAVFGIAALGITIPMIAGAVDLSFGAIMSLAAIGTAAQLSSGTPMLQAMAVGLAIGLGLGILNGVIATVLHLDSMIVTLGTLSVFGGVAFMITNAQRTYAPGDDFAFLGRGFLIGVPVPVWIMLAVGGSLALLLRFTTFGQRCFIVGDNSRAASLSGLSIARTRIAALAISGVAAALAGIVITSNDGLIYAGTGERYLLQGLAAVVIGGTALRGGTGTVVGTLLGIFLLGIVDNGLNLVGVPGVWQDVLRGLILIGALVIDRLRDSRL